MRLNEDEPLVWRDERAKLWKWEVQRRARILEARGETESRKGVSKGRGDGPWQIKMKLCA